MGNAFDPTLRSDAAATGACEVDVQHATLIGDFAAAGTQGNVTFSNNDGSSDFQAGGTVGTVKFENNTDFGGDVQVQNSEGDVYITNVSSTSDISVDGANIVSWTNDQGTGGDAGFSNITTLTVTNVGNVTPLNGLLSIGPVGTATITGSTIKSGLEADLVTNLTVTGNTFPAGGLKVEGGQKVMGGFITEVADIQGNTLFGSLAVSQAEDVTVNSNIVNNGSLKVTEAGTATDDVTVNDNTVDNGNLEVSKVVGDVTVNTNTVIKGNLTIRMVDGTCTASNNVVPPGSAVSTDCPPQFP